MAGFTMSLNLLLLVAMEATNTLSFYHLSSATNFFQSILKSSSSSIPSIFDHLLRSSTESAPPSSITSQITSQTNSLQLLPILYV
ncbi:unnamed protein product, partial [Brassica oleracea var. botrytis]